MTGNQPKKAGEYERPTTGTSHSASLMLGIIAVLAVMQGVPYSSSAKRREKRAGSPP